jgi:hypothetical protein
MACARSIRKRSDQVIHSDVHMDSLLRIRVAIRAITGPADFANMVQPAVVRSLTSSLVCIAVCSDDSLANAAAL